MLFGVVGGLALRTFPCSRLRTGSTIERSSIVPVATAGSRGVYRK